MNHCGFKWKNNKKRLYFVEQNHIIVELNPVKKLKGPKTTVSMPYWTAMAALNYGG